MANESELDRLSELSRHYDTLLWTVITLWAAAIGGLLAFCWDTQDWRLFVLGIALTDTAIYFGLSFRDLRSRIYERMKQFEREFAELHTSRDPYKQWPVLALVFLMLLVLWVWRLYEKCPNHPRWCIGAGIVEIAILIVFWLLPCIADALEKRRKKSRRAEEGSPTPAST